MSDQWFNLEEWLRLFAALLMGAVIGFERELHDKPAGLKTIATVTLAGCLLMMISVHMSELASGGSGNVDIGRVAAGILTGIGFIGAGTIIQSRHRVSGVTTAADIWLMTGVGMAIGAGFYGLALGAYIFGWVGLSLDPLGLWVMRRFDLKREARRAEARDERPGPDADNSAGSAGLQGEDIRPERIGGTRTSSQKRSDRG